MKTKFFRISFIALVIFFSFTTSLKIHAQTIIATNDFNSIDEKNQPLSGNVLTNDYIQNGTSSQTLQVTTTGTFKTSNGGTLVLNADGSYTYTPAKNFSGLDYYPYTVEIKGTNTTATATLYLGISVCTKSVSGKDFSWSYKNGYTNDGNIITTNFNEPGTDYGFVLKIYILDNSFNMKINGVNLAAQELQFQKQSGYYLQPNIRFKSDQGYWGVGAVPNIWTLTGDSIHPIIQVDISPEGTVKIYGSRTSGGPLEELELFNGNYFNNISWNKTSSNTVVVTQSVIGATAMSGSGSGLTITPCINYWYGGTTGSPNEWRLPSNWTLGVVPESEEDVEFATEANNGPTGNGNGKGPAVADLYLDDVEQENTGGRVIGNLINNSDMNLVITKGNQLTIDGTVTDDNADKGTIVVQADPYNATANGTLLFTDPTKNQNVGATVEFYSKAHYCDECGLYKKQWQYFGIPVQSSASFPVGDVDGEETVNQWVEPFNGDKWQKAPYSPDTQLTAFRGYELTNSSMTLPTGVYSFPGTLYVGNATVPLTRTGSVNYSGANLIGNSYTAAIPIATALSFDDTGQEEEVYLFNTGTRDEWRKLDGSTVNLSGVAGGQYLAVPFNLAGQVPSGSSTALPSMIPSSQAFMVLADKATNLNIDYSKLVKNEPITDASGNTIATRAVASSVSGTSRQSGNSSATVASLPALVMDVIGDNSADRVWLFRKSGTTYGFDNGWDGRKIGDENSAQLYVTSSDSSKLQVATVPSMNSVAVGFVPIADGSYTLEFALSKGLSNDQIYLNDLLTGKKQQIVNGGSYTFKAEKGESAARFTLSDTSGSGSFSDDEALISVTATDDGKIKVTNGSASSCSVFISTAKDRLLKRLEVKAGGEAVTGDVGQGTYIVRLQNATVNDMRTLTVN